MTLTPERAREIAGEVSAKRGFAASTHVEVECVQRGYAEAQQERTASLTDEQVAEEWNAARVDHITAPFTELLGNGRATVIRFARAIVSRVAGPDVRKVDALLDLLKAESLDDAYAIVRSHLEHRPDVERAKREAAREALTWAANFVLSNNDSSAIRNYRDHNYPLPAPVPSVTLGDGSVVTWRADIFDGGGWERNNPKALHGCQLISTSENIRDVLTEHTDTGADFDAVKALAARVGK